MRSFNQHKCCFMNKSTTDTNYMKGKTKIVRTDNIAIRAMPPINRLNATDNTGRHIHI